VPAGVRTRRSLQGGAGGLESLSFGVAGGQTTDTATASFWDWFTAAHDSVATAYDRGQLDWLDDALTTRVRAIHPRLNWEIGPYHHPERTLVISPSIRQNIDLARRVVAAAPALPGWHFLPAKPPKELNRLELELPGVRGAGVCADGWTYRLTAYNGLEFFDIEVFTDVAAGVSDGDLRLLASRLIESLVGETVYLERFADVQVHRRPAGQCSEELTPFPLLGHHVRSLLQ
jgi:hypothetical protein